jgi:hypothetical protein
MLIYFVNFVSFVKVANPQSRKVASTLPHPQPEELQQPGPSHRQPLLGSETQEPRSHPPLRWGSVPVHPRPSNKSLFMKFAAWCDSLVRRRQETMRQRREGGREVAELSGAEAPKRLSSAGGSSASAEETSSQSSVVPGLLSPRTPSM